MDEPNPQYAPLGPYFPQPSMYEPKEDYRTYFRALLNRLGGAVVFSTEELMKAKLDRDSVEDLAGGKVAVRTINKTNGS